MASVIGGGDRDGVAGGPGAASALTTTLMIKNVPRKHTPSSLLAEMETFWGPGQVDFVYLPWTTTEAGNMGFAFMNFVSSAAAKDAVAALAGQKWRSLPSSRLIKVSAAFVQGLAANIAYCAHKVPPDAEPVRLPLVWHDGAIVDFESAVCAYVPPDEAAMRRRPPAPGQRAQPPQQPHRRPESARPQSGQQQGWPWSAHGVGPACGHESQQSRAEPHPLSALAQPPCTQAAQQSIGASLASQHAPVGQSAPRATILGTHSSAGGPGDGRGAPSPRPRAEGAPPDVGAGGFASPAASGADPHARENHSGVSAHAAGGARGEVAAVDAEKLCTREPLGPSAARGSATFGVRPIPGRPCDDIARLKQSTSYQAACRDSAAKLAKLVPLVQTLSFSL